MLAAPDRGAVFETILTKSSQFVFHSHIFLIHFGLD